MAIVTTLLEALITATPTPGGYWTKDRLEEVLNNLNSLQTQADTAITAVDTDATLTGKGVATAKLTVAVPLVAVTTANNTLVLTVVDGAWTAKAPSVQTIGAITANYTLLLTDAGRLLKATAAAVISVPLNASVAYSTGQHIDVTRWTTAVVTVEVISSGVTLRAPFGAKIKAPYGAASLIKMGADEWRLVGDCEPV